MRSYQYLFFLLGGLTAAQTTSTASPTCTGDDDAMTTSQDPAQITSASPTDSGSCSTTSSNCYYSYTSCSGVFSFYSNCYEPCVMATGFTCYQPSPKPTTAADAVTTIWTTITETVTAGDQ